jgi:hypothetical protein
MNLLIGSYKIIPGDTNKPKIINEGKEWNVEGLKLKMKNLLL